MPTTDCSLDDLKLVIAAHGGVLRAGAHPASVDGPMCILEAAAKCRGLAWTDDPHTLGRPDIRRLNDAAWPSDAERTEQMTRLYVALAPWATWTEAERLAYMRRVAVATVREVIAELPGLPDALRAQCRAVTTRDEARGAAEAVRRDRRDAAAAAYYAAAATSAADAAAAARAAADAYYAAAAARAAADAATSAADAAAARAKVLRQTVALWIAAIPTPKGDVS